MKLSIFYIKISFFRTKLSIFHTKQFISYIKMFPSITKMPIFLRAIDMISLLISWSCYIIRNNISQEKTHLAYFHKNSHFPHKNQIFYTQERRFFTKKSSFGHKKNPCSGFYLQTFNRSISSTIFKLLILPFK